MGSEKSEFIFSEDELTHMAHLVALRRHKLTSGLWSRAVETLGQSDEDKEDREELQKLELLQGRISNYWKWQKSKQIAPSILCGPTLQKGDE